jgi:hypothetical protein
MTKHKTLEVEFIDPEAHPLIIEMMDGTKITIGKNVQDFYYKLLELPTEYKCQLLKLDINDLQKFIKEQTQYYNQKLIAELNKTWLWRLDNEVYNFSDKDVNNDFFGVLLDKKQIIGRLKRNSFEGSHVLEMLKFFECNDDLKQQNED